MSEFVTHRCAQRPEYYGLRKYTSFDDRFEERYRTRNWMVYRAGYDFEYCMDTYDPVVPARFCPWCGEELP